MNADPETMCGKISVCGAAPHLANPFKVKNPEPALPTPDSVNARQQTKNSSSTASLVTSAACLARAPGSVCLAGECWQCSCKQTPVKMEHMQAHTDGVPI